MYCFEMLMLELCQQHFSLPALTTGGTRKTKKMEYGEGIFLHSAPFLYPCHPDPPSYNSSRKLVLVFSFATIPEPFASKVQVSSSKPGPTSSRRSFL